MGRPCPHARAHDGSRGHTAVGERRRGRGSGISWTPPSPRASTVRLYAGPVARVTGYASAGCHPGFEIGRLSGSEHANVQVGGPTGGLGREGVAGIERAPAPSAGREARDVQGAPVDRDRDARADERGRIDRRRRAEPGRSAWRRPSARPAGARRRPDRPAPPSPGRGPYLPRSRRASIPRSGTRSVARRVGAASAHAGPGRRSRERARSRLAR